MKDKLKLSLPLIIFLCAVFAYGVYLLKTTIPEKYSQGESKTFIFGERNDHKYHTETDEINFKREHTRTDAWKIIVGSFITMIIFLYIIFSSKDKENRERNKAYRNFNKDDDEGDDYMKSKCSLCKGSGKIDGVLGYLDSRECYKCRGTGKSKIE